MNVKDAEDLINSRDESLISTKALFIGHAQGFLECHEAMLSLVKALEYYSKPVFCAACMLNIERGDTAQEALSDYKLNVLGIKGGKGDEEN